MKIFLRMIIVIVIVLASLTSCQKDEDPYRREFVNEAPSGMEENRFQAYVDFGNLQNAEFVGTYRTRVSDNSYVDNYGNMIINYYNVDTDIYKIKARKYWNWLQGYQYISNYTEEYQISSSVLNQIRQQLKNKDFVICHRKFVSGENDYTGLGLLIWAVD